MGEFFRVETDQAVATIRLGRPPMNALNTQLQDSFTAVAKTPKPVVAAITAFAGR